MLVVVVVVVAIIISLPIALHDPQPEEAVWPIVYHSCHLLPPPDEHQEG